MNREEALQKAKTRLALEWNCDPSVFSEQNNQFLLSETVFFEAVTFGNAAVMRADGSLFSWLKRAFAATPGREVFAGINLHHLSEELVKRGKRLSGEHTRYVYLSPEMIVTHPKGFSYTLFENDVAALYRHREFKNAFNFKNDVLAFAAYEGATPVAMAAADNTWESFLHIGVDTLPAYRGRGLGTYLVNALADAIHKQGRMSYYTTWSANIASTRLALSAGFLPVWVSYYAIDNASSPVLAPCRF